jgi:mono/diheme cytochrome c family protein
MWNTEQKVKVKRQKAKGEARSARRVSRRLLFTFCLLPFTFYLSGCRTDMQDTPRYEAFEAADKKTFPDGMSARPLVEGTVPRGETGREFVDRKTDYLYTGQLPGGAQAAPSPAVESADSTQEIVREGGPDVFPQQVLPITKETLERGRDRYNNYCAMCHGMTGESDGMIVRRGYQRPPSLVTEAGLQSGRASAAHYFRTITNGQGAMPSYADMLTAEDRWKIVAYIRALQMTRNRPQTDVPESERAKLGNAGQAGGGHGGDEH